MTWPPPPTTSKHSLYLVDSFAEGRTAMCSCGGWKIRHVDDRPASSIMDVHHLHVSAAESPVQWWEEMPPLLVLLKDAIQYNAKLDGSIHLNTALVRAARDLLSRAYAELEGGHEEEVRLAAAGQAQVAAGEPDFERPVAWDAEANNEPTDIPDAVQPEDALPGPVMFEMNERSTFVSCSACGYIIKNDDDLADRLLYHLEVHHPDRKNAGALVMPSNLQPKVEG